MSKYYPIINNYNLVYTDVNEEIENFNNDDYINAKKIKVKNIITDQLNIKINNDINNLMITKTPNFIIKDDNNLILHDINKLLLQKELTDDDFKFIINTINEKFSDLFIDNNLVIIIELLIYYTQNLNNIKNVIITFFDKIKNIETFKLLIDKLYDKLSIDNYYHQLFYFIKMYDELIYSIIEIKDIISSLKQFLTSESDYNDKYKLIYTNNIMDYDYLFKYPTPYQSKTNITKYSINNRIVLYITKKTNEYLVDFINGINIKMPNILYKIYVMSTNSLNTTETTIPNTITFNSKSFNLHNKIFTENYNKLYNDFKNIEIINNLLNINIIPYATKISYSLTKLNEISLYDINHNLIDIIYEYKLDNNLYIKKIIFNDNNININLSLIENNQKINNAEIIDLNIYTFS